MGCPFSLSVLIQARIVVGVLSAWVTHVEVRLPFARLACRDRYASACARRHVQRRARQDRMTMRSKFCRPAWMVNNFRLGRRCGVPDSSSTAHTCTSKRSPAFTARAALSAALPERHPLRQVCRQRLFGVQRLPRDDHGMTAFGHPLAQVMCDSDARPRFAQGTTFHYVPFSLDWNLLQRSDSVGSFPELRMLGSYTDIAPSVAESPCPSLSAHGFLV